MDFDIKKPTHIFAFLILFFTLFILIIYPSLVFVGILSSSIDERVDVYTTSLDDFVTDPDNKDNEISWQAVGNLELNVSIDSREAEISVPVSWKGYEKFVFIATDPDGFSSSDDFVVYSSKKMIPDVVVGLSDQIVSVGENFEEINLSQYVSIKNNNTIVSWKVIGNQKISLVINNNFLKASYPVGWNGSEIVTITATDSGGNSFSDYVVFTVSDSPPVVSGLSFDLNKVGEISEGAKVLGSVITIIILVGTPFIWYVFVNRYNIKKIFSVLKLRLDRIDEAFLYGLLAAILMYIIIAIIGTVLYSSGVVQEGEDISNVNDIASNLSIPSMVFIIVFLSTCEEIFFRGFLMEKIGSFAGKNLAIGSTAVLFGLAHIGYGKIYPVIMPMIMGLILGIIVYKTKNLYSAIIAHLLFNLASFILFLFAQAMDLEALIL